VDPARGDDAAKLTFAFHDDRGKLLYEHTKTGRRN
jgi:hypothetical protein